NELFCDRTGETERGPGEARSPWQPIREGGRDSLADLSPPWDNGTKPAPPCLRWVRARATAALLQIVVLKFFTRARKASGLIHLSNQPSTPFEPGLCTRSGWLLFYRNLLRCSKRIVLIP